MGFLGDFFNKKAQKTTPANTNRPLEMQFRFLANGQVQWFPRNAEEFITNGYLGNHAIFTIQDWKCQKVASAPSLVYEKRDEKTYKKYKNFIKGRTEESFMRARDIKHKALTEITNHDMQKVLDKPNPFMSAFEFYYGLQAYVDLVGAGYIEGVRDSMDGVTGKIKEMYLPPAHQMVIVSGGISNPMKEFYLSSNPEVRISSQNVCQIRNFSPIYSTGYEHLYGLSRLHAARDIVYSYNKGIEAEASIFEDRGVRTLVSPKNMTDSNGTSMNDLTVEQASDLRDNFNRKIKEVGSGGILFGTVEMNAINIGISPKDMGIVESKKMTKSDYCALYHIPDILFGWSDSNSTYNNLAESRKIALTDSVIPELEKLSDHLNGWLTESYDPGGKAGLVIGHDYEYFSEMQQDRKALVEWMDKANCLTIDERREMLNYGAADPKEENARKIIVSSNMKLLETMDMESFAGSGVNPFDSGDNTDSNA